MQNKIITSGEEDDEGRGRCRHFKSELPLSLYGMSKSSATLKHIFDATRLPCRKDSKERVAKVSASCEESGASSRSELEGDG